MDHCFGRSTVDSRPGQGGALTDAWHTAAMEGGSSSRKHLEKEGTEGNLTMGGGAARERSEAGDEEQWRWQLKLDGDGVRVTQDGK
jgi:hypothetical protein